MNNYCINLKKKKNKPFCKLLDKEITFSLCRECDNKEYKKSTSSKKSPATSGQQKSNNNQMKKYSQTLTKEQQKKIKMHNKSKKLTKLERNRFSVFTANKDKCMFCPATTNLSWHEVFAGRNRQNSIEDGFCLRMCLLCHEKKQEDAQFNEFWHRKAQLYYEQNIGDRKEFLARYRRSYLK